ncbi:hypothetical protein [Deinococcus yavapaiensis]|uniref:Uncharacterized protein n=1 Tax=Deinococcus yavapaiensis KR-236 TaxID=694435 RepID=A0A318S6Q2_9DEIO|nr:hypothetical protein [Deinococcus yavapaiensis]PYE54444.1 hypothetical protein DES52_10581 [Deinococcus yavapaiensis KR-236]
MNHLLESQLATLRVQQLRMEARQDQLVKEAKMESRGDLLARLGLGRPEGKVQPARA